MSKNEIPIRLADGDFLGLGLMLNQETYDQANGGKDHTYEPESHHDGFFSPADCFEMVVKWGDAEDLLAASKLLGCKLEDDGENFDDIDT